MHELFRNVKSLTGKLLHGHVNTWLQEWLVKHRETELTEYTEMSACITEAIILTSLVTLLTN
jgi:hypothetical protein